MNDPNKQQKSGGATPPEKPQRSLVREDGVLGSVSGITRTQNGKKTHGWLVFWALMFSLAVGSLAKLFASWLMPSVLIFCVWGGVFWCFLFSLPKFQSLLSWGCIGALAILIVICLVVGVYASLDQDFNRFLQTKITNAENRVGKTFSDPMKWHPPNNISLGEMEPAKNCISIFAVWKKGMSEPTFAVFDYRKRDNGQKGRLLASPSGTSSFLIVWDGVTKRFAIFHINGKDIGMMSESHFGGTRELRIPLDGLPDLKGG